VLHSSREPGELSQCSKQDDSTINIVVLIIIIIIIIIIIQKMFVDVPESPEEKIEVLINVP